MQAVILAAGEGKRMLPLTLEKPKPLIEVAGKPIIEWILDALPDSIDDITLIVGYKAEMIEERLGSSYKGRPLRYLHQWMPAGTAHALSLARPFLHGSFLLMNADDIHGKEALEEALSHPLALLVSPYDKPEKMGVVEKNADGSLASIVEKPEHPKTNLVSTGAMVLDERIFEYPAPRHTTGEYYITEPLRALAEEHPVAIVEQDLWIPVGCPEDIETAEKVLKTLNRA